MADPDRPEDDRARAEGGQAHRLPDAEPRRMAMGRGYGRDFGGGGLNQGFDGSHGLGYGGSVGPTDYREGFGGEAYGGGTIAADYERSYGGRGEDFGGDDRSWMDARAEGPHRGKGPRAWTRNDERIREQVCERLLQDRLLDAREVDVSVQEGVVTLSGAVPGASDAAHAEMLVRQTPGVTDVRAQLSYRPGTRRVDREEHFEVREGQTTRWGKWVPPFTP
jgi:hypothetical protein